MGSDANKRAMKRKVLANVNITFVMFLSITILVTFLIPHFFVQTLGEVGIRDIGTEIARGNSEPISIIDAIIDWEERNFKVIYQRPHSSVLPFYILPDPTSTPTFTPPFTYVRLSHPQWIMFFKHGACEEFARLFTELAKTAGLDDARVVHNLGLDHAWAEVEINGDWIHVDPSKNDPITKERGIVNDPTYYERPENENGEGKQLFFVYAVDGFGTTQDVTERYVERTGELVVHVKQAGEPVANARVVITKSQESSAPFLTDENGACSFNLGEGEYKIIIESGEMMGYRAERVVNITTDEKRYENISLNEFTFLSPFCATVIDILIWLVFLLLFVSILLVLFWKEKTIIKFARLQIFRFESTAVVSTLTTMLVFIYAAAIASGIYVLVLPIYAQSLLENILAIFITIFWILFAFIGMIFCVDGIRSIAKKLLRRAIKDLIISTLLGLVFLFLYGGFGFMIGSPIIILSTISAILIALPPRLSRR